MIDGHTLLVITSSILTIIIIFILGVNVLHSRSNRVQEYRLQSYPNRPMFSGEDRALWTRRYYTKKLEDEIMRHMTDSPLDF